MRVAVIGGTGELGSPVVRELLKREISVRLLVRDSRRAASFAQTCELIAGDVCDNRAARLVLRGCHAVHISLRAGPVHERLREGGTVVSSVERFPSNGEQCLN